MCRSRSNRTSMVENWYSLTQIRLRRTYSRYVKAQFWICTSNVPPVFSTSRCSQNGQNSNLFLSFLYGYVTPAARASLLSRLLLYTSATGCKMLAKLVARILKWRQHLNELFQQCFVDVRSLAALFSELGSRIICATSRHTAGTVLNRIHLGRDRYFEHVKSYELSFSQDGSSSEDYKENRSTKVNAAYQI